MEKPVTAYLIKQDIFVRRGISRKLKYRTQATQNGVQRITSVLDKIEKQRNNTLKNQFPLIWMERKSNEIVNSVRENATSFP